MLRIIAAVLAIIMVFIVGYTVIGGVINLFHGYGIGESFARSWTDITTLWGLIKQKVEADVIYPMSNANITWSYYVASNPR